MQSKDFTIGVLATTAAILLVGLAVVHTASAPAVADGMTTTSSTGNFILAVGAFIQADEDLVYVIDTSTDRMLVYTFDSNNRRVEIVQGINLGELRGATQPGAAQPPRGQQPGRRGSPPAPQQPTSPP